MDEVNHKFYIGDTIQWTSNGTPKRGEVLGVVPAGVLYNDAFERIVGRPPSRTKGLVGESTQARYLIRVARPDRRDPDRIKRALAATYCAPQVQVIDGTSPSSGKLLRAAGADRGRRG